MSINSSVVWNSHDQYMIITVLERGVITAVMIHIFIYIITSFPF